MTTTEDAATVATPATLPVTERSAVRRLRERGSYDLAQINAILDEALLAHVGFGDGTSTWVLPMTYARVDDRLYLHGAAGNHMLRTLAGGTQACVTVTLLDGLVLARSAFHHSMNYRSVVLFGVPEVVTDDDEALLASAALVEHMVPGRAAETRPPTPAELRKTLILRFPIEEGSAKVRTGGPVDDPDDLARPVWAGVVPVTLAAGPAQPAPEMEPDRRPPVPSLHRS